MYLVERVVQRGKQRNNINFDLRCLKRRYSVVTLKIVSMYWLQKTRLYVVL